MHKNYFLKNAKCFTTYLKIFGMWLIMSKADRIDQLFTHKYAYVIEFVTTEAVSPS